MDFIKLATLAFQFYPTVKAIIDEAMSNHDIITEIKELSGPFASLLDAVGAMLFPKAAPELHIAAAVVALFDPNIVKWIQKSANVLIDPSPGLAVDGMYGPHTRNAVEALQAKLGLKVDGFAGQITQAAIAAVVAALPKPVAAAA